MPPVLVILILALCLKIETTRPYVLALLGLVALWLVTSLLAARHEKRSREEQTARAEAERTAARQSGEAMIAGKVSAHLKTLADRRAALITKNVYGEWEREAWTAEMHHFFASVLWPKLRPEEREALEVDDFDALNQLLLRLVERPVAACSDQRAAEAGR